MITARVAGCNTCDWREGPAEAKFRDTLFEMAKSHYLFSGRTHVIYVGITDCEIGDLKDYEWAEDWVSENE